MFFVASVLISSRHSSAVAAAAETLVLFTDRAQIAQFDARLELHVNRPDKGPIMIAPTEPWESYGSCCTRSMIYCSIAVVALCNIALARSQHNVSKSLLVAQLTLRTPARYFGLDSCAASILNRGSDVL